jgi:hypothetical protein
MYDIQKIREQTRANLARLNGSERERERAIIAPDSESLGAFARVRKAAKSGHRLSQILLDLIHLVGGAA